MINSVKQWKSKMHELLFPYISGFAIIALVVAFVLSLLNIPNIAFVQGMLIGFSLVGNVATLWYWRKKGAENV